MARSALAKVEPVETKIPSVIGKVVLRPLDDVEPNPWNPNAMDEFMTNSLREGLINDGWLASQSLLIWGTDTRGKTRNVIIDGEHRWSIARELGLKKGPMVFLEGISELQAKKLTVKMNAKRGAPVREKLEILLHEFKVDVPDLKIMSIDIGIPPMQIENIISPSLPPPPPSDEKVEEQQGKIDIVVSVTCPSCGHTFKRR